MITPNATLTVERADDAEDAARSPLPDAWTPRLRDVPCFLFPAGSNARTEFGQRGLQARYQALTSRDLGLDETREDERVVIQGKYHQILGYAPYEGAGANVYVTTLGRKNDDA